MKTIRIGDVTVEYTEDGCLSRFPDGSEWGSLAHDTHHYHVIAHRCGYGDDILAYAREHEVVHHYLAHFYHLGYSHTLWALAHGHEPIRPIVTAEESLVQTVQAWLRGNVRPIIGDVAWDRIKAELLELLDTEEVTT